MHLISLIVWAFLAVGGCTEPFVIPAPIQHGGSSSGEGGGNSGEETPPGGDVPGDGGETPGGGESGGENGGGDNGGGQSGENPGGDTGGGQTGGDTGEVRYGTLKADGNDANTYDLIRSNGFNFEAPDNSGEHASAPFRHIRQSYDVTLREYVFDFYMHIKNDDDSGKSYTDRQRNELKTDAHSPEYMVGQEGETLLVSWKFKLPSGMKTTSAFSHVHQIKGVGSDDDVKNPLITFTCRSVSGGSAQQFQIIYRPEGADSENDYLLKTDLSQFLGEWIEAEESVTCSNDGRYSVKLTRMRDKKVLVNFSVSRDMWRGAYGIRPKWGLYRNFGENRSLESQLRDEILKFNDFKVGK